MAEELPTAPRKAGMPLGIKILLGATIGCGGLLVAAFVAGAAGLFWFLSPGEQVPTRAILGPDTVGVLRVNDIAADEGAFALLARAFLELDRAGRRARSREMPESMRWIEALGQANREQNVGGIKLYVPRDATATLELAPGDELPRFVIAANLRIFPRLIKGMLSLISDRAGDVVTTQHAGHEIQVFPSGTALSFHGGTLVWAEDGELMERVLDRMVSAAGSDDDAGPPPAADPPGGWDIHGELTVLPETLAWLAELGMALDPAGPGGTARELRRMSLEVDVRSDDALEGFVSLECASADPVERWSDTLTVWLEDLRARSAAYGVELSFEIVPDGSGVRAGVRATGLRDAIAAYSDRLGEEIAAESGG